MRQRGTIAMPGLLTALGLLALTLFTVRATGCSGSDSGLPVISIEVDGHTVKAEVAATASSRSRGLMYRRSMGKNRGMLFVYERPEALSFWMKNTYLPLSIAFIDRGGTIVHIEDMQPLTTASHKSPVKVPYALEMNKGWFDDKGVAVGAKVTFELPAELDPEGR